MKYLNQKPAKAGTIAVNIDDKNYPLTTDAEYARAVEAIARGGAAIEFNGDIDVMVKLMDLAKKADPKFTRLKDRISDLSGCSDKEAESLALYASNSGKTASEASDLIDNPTIGLAFEVFGQTFKSVTDLASFIGNLSDAGKTAAAGTIKIIVTEDDNPTQIEANLAPLIGIAQSQTQQQATISVSPQASIVPSSAQQSAAILSLLTKADIAATKQSGSLTAYATNIGDVTFIMSEGMAKSLVIGGDVLGTGVVDRAAFQEGTLKPDNLSGKLFFKTVGKQKKKKQQP